MRFSTTSPSRLAVVLGVSEGRREARRVPSTSSATSLPFAASRRSVQALDCARVQAPHYVVVGGARPKSPHGCAGGRSVLTARPVGRYSFINLGRRSAEHQAALTSMCWTGPSWDDDGDPASLVIAPAAAVLLNNKPWLLPPSPRSLLATSVSSASSQPRPAGRPAPSRQRIIPQLDRRAPGNPRTARLTAPGALPLVRPVSMQRSKARDMGDTLPHPRPVHASACASAELKTRLAAGRLSGTSSARRPDYQRQHGRRAIAADG